MPGLLKSNDCMTVSCQIDQNHVDNGVLPAPPTHHHHGLPQPPPRQPHNLQGLLRFAVETGGEVAAGPSSIAPLDEQRRIFLEDALKSMTIDVIEVLIKQIKVFDNVGVVTEASPVDEYLEAFDIILDYVDNIDVANDFYKIGGFTILEPCLRCPNPKIKAGACNLLAELCQNNPFCQLIAVDNNFIRIILEILDKDQDVEVCVKTLYALSCIIRENMDGCCKFLELEGLEIILKTIRKNNDKLRTKSAFFLNALCQMRRDIVEKLINLGYLPVLMWILGQEHVPSHEHVISLMKIILERSPEAGDICRNPVHNLQRILKKNYDFAKDKEECYEESEYCRYLLNRFFPGWSN